MKPNKKRFIKKEFPKIWLSSPHMGEEEVKLVLEAFDSNWIAPLGPHVNGFEEDVASFLEVDHAAALSSGTAALHLALVLLDVQPGDLVFCQSMTFAASANAIRYQGAEPVFIDSEPTTWNMDPNALEEALRHYDALGKRPKAILPVHLYGMPALMADLRELAKQYEVPIVEDAAEALGSTYRGQKCGALGDLGVLSFNGNKIITTGGGGMLVGNDEGLIRQARFLATQARDPAPHYQHSTIGYNYRLSNVLAGIGRGQMKVLTNRVATRRSHFEAYRHFFKAWQEEGFQVEFQEEQEGLFSNRWLSCILLDPDKNYGLDREALRLAFEAANIDARPLWKPMHLQPVFEKYRFFGGQTAETLFRNGLCLPSGSNLSAEEVDRIFAVLQAFFEQVKIRS